MDFDLGRPCPPVQGFIDKYMADSHLHLCPRTPFATNHHAQAPRPCPGPNLEDFAPQKSLSLQINHSDGTQDVIALNHTYNKQQIEWFKYGSALNLIKTNQ